jgi:2-haloacid dehalogenase
MLDFSRFKFISFDCYGTLIDWETGILSGLRPLLARHAAELGDGELLRLYGELEAEAESGEFRSYREVLRDVVRRLAAELGFAASLAEQDALPDSIAKWKPFPDTVDGLRKLHSKFRLAIISNVDDDLWAYTAPQLGTAFDQVITASQAAAYKPSPTIFRLAQQKLGVSTQEWLHAGQSIYHDVIPARSLGIATVWVNRASLRPGTGAVRRASADPDFEVHSLEELARAALHL